MEAVLQFDHVERESLEVPLAVVAPTRDETGAPRTSWRLPSPGDRLG